jgi:Flp pilus assembly protein TadD
LPESISSQARAAYREATALLLEGRAEDALREFTSLTEPLSGPDLTLAIGKAHLELRNGREAERCFRELLRDDAEMEPSMRAYVQLLSAAAASLDGRGEDAFRLLEDVARIAPRMEHAARALRRRVEAGRPPVIRF